ncbi:hypothetical protein [Pseudomonas sp. RIT-To-2]|uniref:hypothetical protein n=1 Tax=Pseudomonas sp. RIT-To-2 TaxID=3462541 RepID=UPI0024133955
MASDERRSATVLKAVGSGTQNAAHEAVVLAFVLEEMNKVLAPILGPVAVAALYRRCLYLCAAAYPCLESLQCQDETRSIIAGIKTVLAEHTTSEARQMAETVIKTFCTLLASLIGSTLTEQLVGECTVVFLERNEHKSGEP